ncbi:hypothetical protein AGABI1DRAFT_116670 [Agaricus bisporus var. burnettii JB137-S8]|uniref:Uncharacterized protein n=1 Tax=Agaricus bisporus var. burnettii (strain JB137-S8 / ATCC MYA-4627 / FGSC 10392) TaxID=597362 RepID=K5XK84_AGABU|nr:uncharacterized protein AGABI1DRAFT_116670 [Agaricus bisporus var. burnettii JB137-S8]EKM74920.1 hypothetical protein AGABI1DRAFT_116670 [Agaricus bisporus var. burnettii JB137-S8]
MWYISSVGTADTYTFRSIRGWYAYSKGNNASHWITDLNPEKASIRGPVNTTLYWNARISTDKVYADPTFTDSRESWRFIPVN